MLRRIPNRISMAHGLMVLAGLITFIAVSASLQDRSATVGIFVAAQPMSAGSVVSNADFAVVQVDAGSELIAGLVPADRLLNHRTARDLASGEPLAASDLVEVGSDVAGRTMAIPVSAVALSGLGLSAGDDVDVIGTVASGELGFVVAGARVTRLPSTQTVGGAFNQSSRQPFVTIEVDEAQALALAVALRAGDIELVRSSGAARLTEESGVLS